MDADEFANAFRLAFKAAGFKHYRRRYYLRAGELIWVVKPERMFRGAAWAIRLACLIRDLKPDKQWPDENECHIGFDYANFGDAVPDTSLSPRFDDHSSYFNAAFDLSYLKMPDAERVDAMAFAARDVASKMSPVNSVLKLASYLARDRPRNLFLSREARDQLERIPGSDYDSQETSI